MPYLAVFLLFFCSTAVTAQSNLTKRDADSLYQEIQSAEDKPENLQSLQLLHDYYEGRRPTPRAVHVKALLALHLYQHTDQDSMSMIYADTAIAHAAAYLGDAHHPLTFSAYLVRMYERYNTAPEESVEAGLDAMRADSTLNNDYFAIQYHLIDVYANTFQPQRLNAVVDYLDTLLASDSALLRYTPVLYAGKMYVAFYQSNLEQAVIYGEECIARNEQHDFFTANSLGTLMANLGMFYGRLLNTERGLYWIDAASRLQNLSPDDPLLASYLIRKASLYNAAQRYPEGIQTLEHAIRLMRSAGQEYAFSLDVAYYNLSLAHYNNDDIAAALTAIENYQNFTAGSFTVDSHYGNLLDLQEHYEEALFYHQSALTKISPTFTDSDIFANPDSEDEFTYPAYAANILNNKASVLYRLARREKSAEYLLLAENTNRIALQIATQRKSNLVGFELAQYHDSSFLPKLLMTRASIQLLRHQLTSEPHYREAALLAVEQKKAGALVKTLQKDTLPDDFTLRLKAAQDRLFYARESEATAAPDSIDYYRRDALAASDELATISRELRRRYPRESSYFYDVPYPKITELQAMMSPGELLIDYLIGDKIGWAFVIGSTSVNVYQLDLNRKLPATIRRFHQLLQSPLLVQRNRKSEFLRLGQRLYDQLLAPLAAELATHDRLYILPDAELYTLPFEALLNGATIDQEFSELPFLLKTHEISYNYSATSFKLMREIKPIEDRSLLAFAPVFDGNQSVSPSTRANLNIADTLMRGITDGVFDPLPATREEVRTIGKLLPRAAERDLLIAESASLQSLTNYLRRRPYQFVHIATHGLANTDVPTRSGLACYPDTTANSELLFAGQIQRLPLRADLVVLSSCDSGIGQLTKGEGLLALNRSFIYAGARNVISSLWKVEDRHTRTLMVEFYRAYLQDGSYTKALRSAKHALLNNSTTAAPRYWAPFLLIGE